jgi:hypothetical protein
MSLKLALGTKSRRRGLLLGLGGSVGAIGAVGLLLGLGGSVGCETYPTFEAPLPTDCSTEDTYDLHMVSKFDTAADGSALWGPAGDPFCNGNDGGPPKAVSLGVETMSDGPRCGSKAALLFRSANCNDWGALAGFSNFGPRDESAYEGMSFWARSPGNTGKAFSIVLDDANTAGMAGSNCTVYDAGAPGQGTVTVLDPATGTPISGTTSAAAMPDQCGNAYNAIVPLTGEWRFYTIPWSQFTQTAQPNRVPNVELTETGGIPGTGLLPSKIYNLIVRVPKEMKMELWIDNLSFYRKKGAAAGADAGPDAAQK